MKEKFNLVGHMTLDHGIGVCGISVAFSWHSGESSASFSLTQNLPRAIIISVEIEATYALVKTGQNHKGSGNISTRKH